MKTNTYMLLRVIYEQCKMFYREDDLKMKTIETSCILCVHIHQDTFPFMMMSKDVYAMMIIIIMPDVALRSQLTSRRRYRQLARL